MPFCLVLATRKRKFFAFLVQHPWLDHDVLQEVVRDGLIEPFVLRAVPDQDAERLDHGFDGVIRHVLPDGLSFALLLIQEDLKGDTGNRMSFLGRRRGCEESHGAQCEKKRSDS